MGKQVYLSKKEAEWIMDLVEYHDAPINKEDEEVIISIRNKAESVLRKDVRHGEFQV